MQPFPRCRRVAEGKTRRRVHGCEPVRRRDPPEIIIGVGPPQVIRLSACNDCSQIRTARLVDPVAAHLVEVIDDAAELERLQSPIALLVYADRSVALNEFIRRDLDILSRWPNDVAFVIGVGVFNRNRLLDPGPRYRVYAWVMLRRAVVNASHHVAIATRFQVSVAVQT